jgi:hypothetical protein
MLRRTIIDALEAEWPVVASSGLARSQLEAWQRAEPDLSECSTLAVLVSEILRREGAESVRLMRPLVRVAASDPLARRAVLQVMVPVMCARIRAVRAGCSRSGAEIDLDEASQLVVTAMVSVIDRVAGRDLTWPIIYLRSKLGRKVNAAVSRLIREQLALVEVELAPPAPAPSDSLSELRDLLVRAARRGVVSQSDAQLVWLTRVGGWKTHELTDRFGATRDTLLRRRSRAERAIARVA